MGAELEFGAAPAAPTLEFGATQAQEAPAAAEPAKEQSVPVVKRIEFCNYSCCFHESLRLY